MLKNPEGSSWVTVDYIPINIYISRFNLGIISVQVTVEYMRVVNRSQPGQARFLEEVAAQLSYSPPSR
jgi:hypothetical protein